MTANPTLLSMPLAQNGQKNVIPETQATAGDGLFSQSTGFPAETSLPLGAGGKAPTREDFNGLANLLGGVAYYAQKGWIFQFDAGQEYFAGCIVRDMTDGALYECINDVAAGGSVPSADSVNWKAFSTGDGLKPLILVKTPTGCTVTCAMGAKIVTGTEVAGTGESVWEFEIPSYGTWTVTCEKAGMSTSKTVKVSEVKQYDLTMHYALRYGYRIKKTEADPNARVEYIFDSVGMTPAKMDFTAGKFDYGDWVDKWFVTENKPLMLKSDGTADYYLNPNNYAEKEDGTASDVSNTAYDGNAMAQFPLVWVKRYEDSEYEYEIVSYVQYDEDYKAYAHTRADGSIAEFFYWSMFGGSGSATKIRSLADQTLAYSLTAQNEIDGCKANGAGWYTHSWSQHELLRTLLILMGKSTNTQSVFGNGNCRSATTASGLLATGTLKDKGQFYGYNTNTQQVKVFHVEKFWGDQWDRVAGLIATNAGHICVKMTPEGSGYRINDTTDYTDTGIVVPPYASSANNGTYINVGTMSEYGFIPTKATGSSSTFYPDGLWGYKSSNAINYPLVGASANNAAASGGAFAVNLDSAPSYAGWADGCGLSCEQPVAI